MNRGAQRFRGTHNFSTFTADKSKKDHRKTVFECRLERQGKRVDITVRGDGFLWNQVRIMAALLIQIGKGQLGETGVSVLLEKQDRSLAPAPAPAQGLTLMSVTY
jgi:tRNA pseudouridine38-40 synthase